MAKEEDMSRYSKTQKSILIAAMVILLCILSITGATFALFTSRSDGKIGINATSGKVDIDIVNTSIEGPSSLVGEVLEFQTTASKRKVLFEPGATYHTEGFRVVNLGNIPINFIIYLSEDEDHADAPFEAAFDVWLTDDYSDLSRRINMEDFAKRLEVGGESDIYYLVVRMKEDAGNTYQDQVYSGIGITVRAVQGNAELK